MSLFSNPFDPGSRLACACGRHASQAEHARAEHAAADGGALDRAVEGAVMHALFPQDALRRRFLRAVGGGTALAAVSALFPLAAAKEAFAQSGGPLEKRKLKVGFIPITCATPIIMAHPMGCYGKQGLDVEVVKTAGWALIREQAMSGEYDAAHMLSPMPLAITLGVGASRAVPWTMPAVENINGQAITLSMKHKDRRDPKDWKGFKFAVPFDYSMHNYLLRYYLAEHGLDPDTDVQIRAVPPPEMVANLRADNIDGFLAPDPVNQRAVYDGVGFIHTLSKAIWDGHPCCAFSASREFVTTQPNTYQALLKAIIEATAYARAPAHRKEIATAIAAPNYQPAGHRGRAGADRHLRRRPGQGADRSGPHRLRSDALGLVRGVDPDADEALGPGQGRRGLPEDRQRGVLGHRRGAPDARGRPDPARRSQ